MFAYRKYFHRIGMMGLILGLVLCAACIQPDAVSVGPVVEKATPPADVSDFLKNGGFENPGTSFVAGDWIWEAVFSAPRECYTLSNDAIEGNRALLVRIKRDQFPGLFRKGTYAHIRQNLSFKKVQGASLCLTGYFKILSRGATSIEFWIRQRAGEKQLKNALNQHYDAANLEPGKWHAFRVCFEVDPEAVQGDFACALNVDVQRLEGDTNCAVLFDGFRVEAAD